MSAFLASVRSLVEARAAFSGGADVIDLKDPRRGALGAVAASGRRAIAAALGGRVPLSATIGDDVPVASLADAVRAVAGDGVDVVKVGLMDGLTAMGQVLEALAGTAARGVRLWLVLPADRLRAVPALGPVAAAGVEGVMLDTADKAAGRLTELWPLSRLRDFVAEAHAAGLGCGLAGRLALGDVPVLRPLGADVLGFRGALCARGVRTQALDPRALAAVRAAMGPPASGWRWQGRARPRAAGAQAR